MAGIDVFIPLHAKDLAVAPLAITSLRRYLSPSPGRIVVVSEFPEVLASRALRRAGAELIPAQQVPDIPPRAEMPSIVVKGQVRTGWYYQQLLKWGVRRLATSADYLIWDGDTLAITPVQVMVEGQAVFDRGDQYHLPYFSTIESLLGFQPGRQDSFITNYMVFNCRRLDQLIQEIESRHPGLSWSQTILATIDRTEMSSFSEYETYGYWLQQRHPGTFLRGMGRNRDLRRRHRFYHWFNRRRALARGCTTLSYFNHKR